MQNVLPISQDDNKIFKVLKHSHENEKKKKIRMFVFLSSIGATRTKSFPTLILSVFLSLKYVCEAGREGALCIEKLRIC